MYGCARIVRYGWLEGELWCYVVDINYIRLADGRFRWPRTPSEARQLTSEQFTRLMEGYTIDPSVGKERTVEKKDPKLQRKK